MQDGISQCAISFHGPWQTPLARSPYVTQGSADMMIYFDNMIYDDIFMIIWYMMLNEFMMMYDR